MTQSDFFTRPLVIALVAVLLLPVLLMVFMIPMLGMGMGMGAWSGGHMVDTGMWGTGGGWWLWMLLWLVPLLLIVGVGYLLYVGLQRSDDETNDAAIEELRIAYARGDLSEEEFEKRRERLE